jgi:hypothetical protein
VIGLFSRVIVYAGPKRTDGENWMGVSHTESFSGWSAFHKAYSAKRFECFAGGKPPSLPNSRGLEREGRIRAPLGLLAVKRSGASLSRRRRGATAAGKPWN